jgi:methionyl-tRNA synthetase
MTQKKICITTAIDYINDVIHIGHAYQKVAADVLARYYRILNGKDNVFFLTGTDEHGLKAEESARESKKNVKEFADEIAAADKKEQDLLNVSYDRFIRTTDSDHIVAAVDFWKRIKESGDIYLDDFTGKYCSGCESFKTESELENNHCPLHLKEEIKLATEKNYFFRWKRYVPFLKEHITSHPEFVLPSSRRNEVLAFVDKIEDITISRRKEAVSWGIEVPGDPDQLIYVWFEALINYLTGALPIGFWGEDTKIIHILGKDNLRWHALLWPAMLKSAGYPLPATIFAHGFLIFNGQKISKSLGNITRPSELVSKYGADPVRYYLLGRTNFAEDNDVTISKLEDAYNGDLANGLGNFAARVLTLAEKIELKINQIFDDEIKKEIEKTKAAVAEKLNEFKFHEALAVIWNLISFSDRYINENKPWETRNEKVMFGLVVVLDNVAALLAPFMPQTAEKITKSIIWQDGNLEIKKPEILFPRLNK